jgi:hypothetical protein
MLHPYWNDDTIPMLFGLGYQSGFCTVWTFRCVFVFDIIILVLPPACTDGITIYFGSAVFCLTRFLFEVASSQRFNICTLLSARISRSDFGCVCVCVCVCVCALMDFILYFIVWNSSLHGLHVRWYNNLFRIRRHLFNPFTASCENAMTLSARHSSVLWEVPTL